jgi:hypothetical protein
MHHRQNSSGSTCIYSICIHKMEAVYHTEKLVSIYTVSQPTRPKLVYYFWLIFWKLTPSQIFQAAVLQKPVWSSACRRFYLKCSFGRLLNHLKCNKKYGVNKVVCTFLVKDIRSEYLAKVSLMLGAPTCAMVTDRMNWYFRILCFA